MADEEIRVLIEIEDADALQKAKEFQEQVDVLKSQLQSLANTSNRSFDVIAEGMRRQAEEAKNLKLDEINLGIELGDPADPEKVKEINDAYRETLKNITVALRQVKDDQGEVYKQGANLAKQSAKEQTEASKQSQAAIREYEKITRQGYGVMSSAAQQYSQIVQKTANIIQNTAQRSGQSWQQVAQRMTQLGVPINQINNALKLLNTQSQQTASSLSNITNKVSNFASNIGNLGTVGKYVFGTVLGLTAVSVIRDLIQGIKNAAAAALDFQQKLFAFQISVRALQRAGLDTTLEEWYGLLQDIKEEFPIFSRRDITEAAAIAGLMTREFGFTQTQIENVIRSSAALSFIWGKDLAESVRGLTYAISAGYFESLQRVGFQISRSIVAQEALRRGYEGGYNAISEQARAAITYDIIMSQVNSVVEDTNKLMETQAGQVLALKGNWDDLRVAVGDFVVDVFDVEGLKEVNQTLIDMANILRILGDSKKRAEFFNMWVGFTALGGQLKVGTPEFEEAQQAWRNYIAELGAVEADFEDAKVTLEEPIKIGGVEFSPEEFEKIDKAIKDLFDELIDLEKDMGEKRDEIIDDFTRDGAKAFEEYLDKLIDLERDFQQRLDDINEKAQQQKEDAIADYAYRTAEVIRDAAQRREDAERKYRDREIREERKFQEKLRQLRENFLLDLEDAVRERDARQIIRLTRQYNLRRDQMIREEKISKDDRQAAFEEELREIERQRQERLRQLAIEHERRLKEIDLQAERERERAKIEYERRKDDEEDRYNEQKTDRKNRLAEQLDDIETSTQDRINKILEGIQKEYDLSSEQLNAVGLLWESYYGPDGRIDRAVTWIEQRLAQSFQFMNMLRAQLEAFRFSNIPPGGYLGEPPPGYAKGGTIIAKKPTVALFGEAGPEMATFTPLNKLPDKSAPPTQMFSARDPQTGRIRLEMLLSPDLEARIIDNTLGEIADVNLSIERARK